MNPTGSTEKYFIRHFLCDEIFNEIEEKIAEKSFRFLRKIK